MDPKSSAMRVRIGPDRVLAITGPGDITSQQCDAVVNAANSSLLGGGGVDGAIHRAGGPEILAACREIVARIGPLPAGQAVATPGGRLAARYVIHTVGPVWYGGEREEAATLASCHYQAVRVADQLQLASIAFPAISTGIYGYPMERAAETAVAAAADALEQAAHVRLLTFVLFDHEAVKQFQQAASALAAKKSYRTDTFHAS